MTVSRQCLRRVSFASGFNSFAFLGGPIAVTENITVSVLSGSARVSRTSDITPSIRLSTSANRERSKAPFVEMAKRKDGGRRNLKTTVNADQVTYQQVLLDSAAPPDVHQPIPGPRPQNNGTSGAAQETRDVAVDGVQRHQQQQGNGPDTAAQTQEMARPETAPVQQRRQKRRRGPDPSAVSADRKKPGNRRFVCTQCAKTFHYKHVLQNHIRMHTGEKPYTCTVCQKKFTRAHHPNTHKRLHTGEKPYLCMCCNKVFMQVSNLRRHLKTHIGYTSMNLCGYCGVVFATVDDLAVHWVKVGTRQRRCQSFRNNTTNSDSAASTSAAAAVDSTSAASTSAAAAVSFTSAASTSTAAAVDSTSAASTSAAAAAVGSTSATGSAELSAFALVVNRPPPWWSSTPAHLHPTSVHHAPALWSSTNYGSYSPWMPNAVGYPTAPAFVYGDPPAAPAFVYGGSPAAPAFVYGGSPAAPAFVYGGSPAAPTFVYGGSPAAPTFLYGLPAQAYGSLRPTYVHSPPAPSFLRGPQPQPLMTSVSPSPPTAAAYGPPPPSLPNGSSVINPYQQYQIVYAAQQTEPEDLSVRMDVYDEHYSDSDDSGKLVIVTDDSDEHAVDTDDSDE